MYGPDCDKACGDCVNGWCDSDCGSCVCFPGWMGDDCNTGKFFESFSYIDSDL